MSINKSLDMNGFVGDVPVNKQKLCDLCRSVSELIDQLDCLMAEILQHSKKLNQLTEGLANNINIAEQLAREAMKPLGIEKLRNIVDSVEFGDDGQEGLVGDESDGEEADPFRSLLTQEELDELEKVFGGSDANS